LPFTNHFSPLTSHDRCHLGFLSQEATSALRATARPPSR